MFRSQWLPGQQDFYIRDVLDLMDEPLVNLRDLMDLVNARDAAAQGFGNHEDAFIVDARKVLLDAGIIPLIHLFHMQAVHADLQRAGGLEDCSLEMAVNAHDLARSLHLRTERTVSIDKLVERPAREFDDTVIKCRLEAGFRLLGNCVGDLIERIADGNLGRNLGNRIAGSLGSQCRRTADTRVDLNDIVAVAVRIQCILRIAAALDAKLADNAQAGAAEHLIFMVRQRLRRSHNDGIARVYTNRIEVLHVADRDAVIIAITHDLILDLFPAGHTALDEHLANHGVVEALDDDIDEFFLIIRDTAARSAHRVGRAHDDRIADGVGKLDSSRDILNNRAFRNRLTEFLHGFLEQLAVLRFLDSGERSAQQFYLMLFQDAALGELYSQIQASLSAQRCQQAIRFLLGDDLFQKLRRQRFDIDPVSNMGIGHDRSRIGIDQNDFQTFFFQRTASL